MAETTSTYASALRSQIDNWRARNQQIEQEGARKIAPFFKQAATQVREEEGYRQAAAQLSEYATAYLGKPANFFSSADVRRDGVTGIKQGLDIELANLRSAESGQPTTENVGGVTKTIPIATRDIRQQKAIDRINAVDELSGSWGKYSFSPIYQDFLKRLEGSDTVEERAIIQREIDEKMPVIKETEDYREKVRAEVLEFGYDLPELDNYKTKVEIQAAYLPLKGMAMVKAENTKNEIEIDKEIAKNRKEITGNNSAIIVLPELAENELYADWFEDDETTLKDEVLKDDKKVSFIRKVGTKYENEVDAIDKQARSLEKLANVESGVVSAVQEEVGSLYSDLNMQNKIMEIVGGINSGIYEVKKGAFNNLRVVLRDDNSVVVMKKDKDIENAIAIAKSNPDFDSSIQLSINAKYNKVDELEQQKATIASNIINEYPPFSNKQDDFIVDTVNGDVDYSQIDIEPSVVTGSPTQTIQTQGDIQDSIETEFAETTPEDKTENNESRYVWSGNEIVDSVTGKTYKSINDVFYNPKSTQEQIDYLNKTKPSGQQSKGEITETDTTKTKKYQLGDYTKAYNEQYGEKPNKNGGGIINETAEADTTNKTKSEITPSKQTKDSSYSDIKKVNATALKDSLSGTESKGGYKAKNGVKRKDGTTGHYGKYQFSLTRLREASRALNEDITKDKFLNSPALQERVMDWHIDNLEKDIKNRGLDRYIGKTIDGIKITMNGLIAGAHIGGAKGLEDYIKSNGKKNAKDANDTSIGDYVKIHANDYGDNKPAIQKVDKDSVITSSPPKQAETKKPEQKKERELKPLKGYPHKGLKKTDTNRFYVFVEDLSTPADNRPIAGRSMIMDRYTGYKYTNADTIINNIPNLTKAQIKKIRNEFNSVGKK